MRKLLIIIIIVIVSLFSLTFAEKKQWKQPQLKEGQTIQEAFKELRQNKNQNIEKRKQEVIQERKDIKKASKSEALKEKKYRSFDFSNKYDKKQEKKMRRAKASESQIDRLDPRKFEVNDLMDIEYKTILLAEEKDEIGENGKKE